MDLSEMKSTSMSIYRYEKVEKLSKTMNIDEIAQVFEMRRFLVE